MNGLNKLKNLSRNIGLLLILLFTFSCANLFTPDQYALRAPSSESIALPELNNDEDKLKVLLAIHKEIPELFSDAARFDIDLMKILDDQTELQKLLEAYPEFSAKWNARHLLQLNIVVDDKDGQVVHTKQIKDEALLEWRKKIVEAAKKHLKKEGDLESILKNYFAAQGRLTSGGVLNGLILNLPKELQPGARELQKAANDTAMEDYLLKNLPSTLSNFKSTPQETNLLREHLVGKWKLLSEEEKSIGPLTDLFVLTHPRNITTAEQIVAASLFDREDMANLGNPDFQQTTFAKLFNQDNPKTPPFYEKHVKNLLSQVEITGTKVEDKYSLTLREQNPNIAIFRGCTGGDCSSQYSFPYPNDPNERVFFVSDKNTHLKGYVSATVVKNSDGTKGLYVVTIAGNRINSSDTELILQALYHERAALGVDTITLPNANNIHGLINFTPIREIYSKAVLSGKPTTITYNNQDIRQQIQGFNSNYNSGQYDHMELNSAGVIYTPTAENKMNFKTTTAVLPSTDKYLTKPDKINIYAFWEFYQALVKSNRDSMAASNLDLATDSEGKTEFLKLTQIVQSKERLTTQEVNEVFDNFSEHFDFDEQTAKRFKDNYALNALLSAKDAHVEPNKSKNIERIMADFKYSKNDTVIGRNANILLEWKTDVINHPNFEKLRIPYLELLKDETTDTEAIANDVRFRLAVASKIPDHYELSFLRTSFAISFLPEMVTQEFAHATLKKARATKDYTHAFIILQSVFFQPETANWGDVVEDYIKLYKETGDKKIMEELLSNVFQWKHSVKFNHLFPPLIQAKDTIVWDKMISWVISHSEAASTRRDLLKVMLEVIDHSPEMAKYLDQIAIRILPNAPKFGWKDEVVQTIRLAKKYNNSQALQNIINAINGMSITAEWDDVMMEIVKTARVMNDKETFKALGTYYFSKEHANPAIVIETLKYAIEQKNGFLVEQMDNGLFKYKIKGPEWDPIKKMINNRTFTASQDWTRLSGLLNEHEGVKPVAAGAANCAGAIKPFLK